jgi:uncharacterized protein (DUF2141 family)
MQKILIIFLFFCIVNLTAKDDKVELTVKVTNIRELKGEIEIGFYNNPEAFPDDGGQYKKLRVKVTSKTMYISVKLPKGEWAVALYHDENNDKKINKNFLGIPKEPYAFSNNVKPVFSAPSFEKTKFKLYKNKTITVRLID